MKVNIDIPDNMLKVIDDRCEAEFFSRSEWIRTALREKLFPLVRIKEIEPSETGTMPVENITSTVPIEKKPISIPGVVPANKLKVDPAIGFCELHYDVKGPNKRTFCTWEDENGTVLIEKKWLCDDCVVKYRDMGRGHLYFL